MEVPRRSVRSGVCHFVTLSMATQHIIHHPIIQGATQWQQHQHQPGGGHGGMGRVNPRRLASKHSLVTRAGSDAQPECGERHLGSFVETKVAFR